VYVDQLSTDVVGLALPDYRARVLRRWWIVAICLVLGVVGALAFSTYQGKQFTSTSLVLVTPTDALQDAASGRGGSINLDTEAQIVRSVGVATAAKTLMRSDESTATLLRAVNVSVPPNSQVLAITYTADSARGAQGGSHAFAQAYLDQRTSQVEDEVKTQSAALSGQIKDLSTQLRKVTGQIASLPSNSSDRAYADAQKTILSSQIMALNNRLAPLREATATPGRIITDAPLPTKPSSLSPTIILVAGIMVGLLAGLALASLAAWADRKVRRPSDVTARTNLHLLGVLKPAHRRRGAHLGSSGHGEDVDRVRNALLSSHPGELTFIQVMSSGRGASAGASVALASSFSETGPTALVLLHAVQPVTGWLGLTSPGPGLSELLSGTADLDDVLQPVPGQSDLFVVLPGSEPQALRRLLAASDGVDRLRLLSKAVDHVVIDTADAAQAAVSQSLVAWSDVVILVAERGRTDGPSLTASADEVARFEGALAGVVLAPPLKRSWHPTAVQPAPSTTPATSSTESTPTADDATDEAPTATADDVGDEGTTSPGGSSSGTTRASATAATTVTPVSSSKGRSDDEAVALPKSSTEPR
jgi:uncharacterized protein involved in exopolysaccharide biosynthesis/Mrp family chromosome partitioning ATPase